MKSFVSKLRSLTKKQRILLSSLILVLLVGTSVGIYKKIEADKYRAEVDAIAAGIKQGIENQLGGKSFEEARAELDNKYPPQAIKFYTGLKFPTYNVTQNPQQLSFYKDYFVDLKNQYEKDLKDDEGYFVIRNELGSQELLVNLFPHWYAFSKEEVGTALGDYQLWLRGKDELSQQSIYIDIDPYADFDIGTKAGCEQLMRREFHLDADGIPSLAYKTYDFNHQKSRTHNTCTFIGEGTLSRSLDIRAAISTDAAPTDQLTLRTLIPKNSSLLPETLEILKSVKVEAMD